LLNASTVRRKRLNELSNAYAERFVRTIKESCLERLILFGKGSVRRAAAEFVAHYHGERNHQGLDNQLICPDPNLLHEGGNVKRHERLGGLVNYYYRTAASATPDLPQMRDARQGCVQSSPTVRHSALPAGEIEHECDGGKDFAGRDRTARLPFFSGCERAIAFPDTSGAEIVAAGCNTRIG
jgi:hypothetical protein